MTTGVTPYPPRLNPLGERVQRGRASQPLEGHCLQRPCSLDIWKTEIVLRRSKILIVIGIQIGSSGFINDRRWIAGRFSWPGRGVNSG